jgi:hypothetical protein
MARPKKVVEAVEEAVSDSVQTEENVQKKVQNKTVAMVRSEEYPEPRSADVNPSEVEEWSKYGWTKK